MNKFRIKIKGLFIFVIIVQCIVFPYSSKSQVILNQEFRSLLNSSGLVFDQTGMQDYTSTRVLINKQVSYDFAIKHKHIPMEIRYAIHKLEGTEATLRAYALTILMNMAKKGNPDPEILSLKEINQEDIKSEYGADMGNMMIFVPDPTFSTYKAGTSFMMINFNKKTIAVKIILYNPTEENFIPPEILEAFSKIQYDLRFNVD